MMRKINIGTRGSKLALWQAHAVEDAIRAAMPDVETEISIISTTGDIVSDKPLEKIGDTGLFTKELEQALLSGAVDMCVHSMKDMAAELPCGCKIGAMLERADARDVLVCGPRISATSMAEVPEGARIGTGSLRRVAQIRARFPQIVTATVRGNVDTRIAKADGDELEGVILAAAGIQRMGFASRISAFIPIEEIVPAVGQGAIGIEIRTDDPFIEEVCHAVGHGPTEFCVGIEREILFALNGGCQVPIGAYARYEDDRIAVDAVVASLDGKRMARVSRRFDGEMGQKAIADEVIRDLASRGAEDILASLGRMGGLS